MIKLDYEFKNYIENNILFYDFDHLEGDTLREKAEVLIPIFNKLIETKEDFFYWIVSGPEMELLFSRMLENRKNTPLNKAYFENKRLKFEGIIQNKWELYTDFMFPFGLPTCGLIIGRNKITGFEEMEYKKIKIKIF